MKNNNLKIFLSSLFVLLFIILSVIFFFPNVKKFENRKFFYVRKGYTMADVDRELVKQRIIKRPSLWNSAKAISSFDDDDIHPGRYEINKNMSNMGLIWRIRYNKETPTVFDFTQTKTPPQFSNQFYQNTECMEEEVHRFFYSPEQYQKWNYDSMSLLSVFFRDKFEAKWSQDFRKIANDVHEDYLKFWDDAERQKKLEKLGMDQKSLMILASIVQGEIRHDDEAGKVAQVYINRLKKGMKLQADPTVIYSLGDFTKNRVSYDDLKVNSPFNTYRHKGLPPGPIQTVRKEIVDSILVSRPNDYLYFCADPNHKGYHAFASNYEEHQKNADAYHKYLDSQNIK